MVKPPTVNGLAAPVTDKPVLDVAVYDMIGVAPPVYVGAIKETTADVLLVVDATPMVGAPGIPNVPILPPCIVVPCIIII